MFTGIVEEVGKVAGKSKVREGFRFRIKGRKVPAKLKVSDSVSVNGVCQTIISKRGNEFEFISVHETLKKTNLGGLKQGDEVNLESSLRIGDEIGGHFVFGHIDNVGIVSSIKRLKKSENYEFIIKTKGKYRKYIIPAGSVCINGVSLTVAKIYKKKKFRFKTAIIPYTFRNTNFKNLKKGDKVNIEFDFLGKYVLNMMKSFTAETQKRRGK